MISDPFRRLRGLGSQFFNHRSRTDAQTASVVLARILSQRDLELLPYQEGVEESKRRDQTRQISLGLWIVPLTADADTSDVSLRTATPVVSCDFRREGIGILVCGRFEAECCIVATADHEDVWRFFMTTVRHRTPRPGNWTHIGLRVDSVLQPSAWQMHSFREAVASVDNSPTDQSSVDHN